MQFQDLHPTSPYEGFDPLPELVRGFASAGKPFEAVVERTQPQTIIEVGTWLGASAFTLAALAPQANILCVDTWLGSHTWYGVPGLWATLNPRHGYPQIYYQFLSNVIHRGLTERITPLPLPSTQAAGVLRKVGLSADLIYIDGGHEEDEVMADLKAYWPLTKKLLFGDDWGVYAGVASAVNAFAKQHRLKVEVIEHKWLLTR